MHFITVDLHMHSCLSPCGDDFMTPGNIVGMAKVNGLDCIALTDHNITLNTEAAVQIGKEYGITVIPGMELETVEEIHVVCLFPDTETARSFYEYIMASYPQTENKPDIFGCQQIMNSDDLITGEYPYMLLSPTGISVDEVIPLAEKYGGIAYPAHVDRDSFSCLASLGALPYDYPHKFVEISYDCDEKALIEQYPFLSSYALLRASDAHYLEHMSEGNMHLLVEENTPLGVIKALKSITKDSIYFLR